MMMITFITSKYKQRSISATRWTFDKDVGSSVKAQLNTYGPGGYYVDLNTTMDTSAPIIDYLRDRLWIDRGTRAVFIDFTVYNANINLFCVIK